MPIFEYHCTGCDSHFEKIVWRDNEEVECPSCGSRGVEKDISTFAVSNGSSAGASREPGPCACGAPRRGMCGE